MTMNIAIDGPAGAGKSTIAKLIAKKKNYIYVDTGAMYRTLAVHFIRAGLDKDDEKRISAACDFANVSIKYVNNEQHVYLNGEDVTLILRTEEVGNMASASSVFPAVRNKLKELQQDLARKNDVVMDGRDIGTVILPDAQVKVFLTASSKVRAQRRFDELKLKGIECDINEIEKDIIERDYRDSHRKEAPLKQAEDAIYIDSSDMTIDEVAEKILSLIK